MGIFSEEISSGLFIANNSLVQDFAPSLLSKSAHFELRTLGNWLPFSWKYVIAENARKKNNNLKSRSCALSAAGAQQSDDL